MSFDFDKTLPFIIFSMMYLVFSSVSILLNNLEAWALAASLIAYAVIAHAWTI